LEKIKVKKGRRYGESCELTEKLLYEGIMAAIKEKDSK